MDAITLRKMLPDNAVEKVNNWLARGDGVAVYENVAFDSSDFGHHQFVSFGSPQAQLEMLEPPERLPDIGPAVNWRFHLVGTYRGDALPITLPDEDLATTAELFGRLFEHFNVPNRGVSFGEVKVTRQLDESYAVTFHFEVRCVAPDQGRVCRVDIDTVANRDAMVNRLGGFSWRVWTGENHTGEAENLGAAMVSTYNLSMHPEDS